MFPQLTIPPNWRYWNVHHQVRLQLDQTTGNASFTTFRRFALLVITLFILDILLLLSIPLSPLGRFHLGDPSLIYRLPVSINIIFIPFALNNLYLHLVIYRKGNQATAFIREILFGEPAHEVNEFFAQVYVFSKRNRRKLSIELARQYAQLYIYMLEYFVGFESALVLFYLIDTIIRIFQNSEYFFSTISGVFSLLPIFISALIIFVFTLLYGTIHIVVSTIFVSFTMTAFIQFSQVNALLVVQNSSKKLTNLIQFTTLHTRMLRLVFAFNAFYGWPLFIFMLCQVPVNSYLLTRLLLGQFGTEATIIFLNFILMEFIGIFLIHILSAFFCKHIHACTKRLFSWSINSGGRIGRFKIDCYLMKFHVSKKYGLTYGAFGLMSSRSFMKFVLIYFEILLYWYKLVQY